MKCRIFLHFFLVFTVPLGISSLTGVKSWGLNSLNNSCFSALSSSDITEILLAGPDANKKK